MKFGPPPEEARHLETLGKNATQYFDQKFEGATVHHMTQWANYTDGTVLYFLVKSYFDMHNGVQYRVIVIDDLGRDELQLHTIASYKFGDGKKFGLQITGLVPTTAMPFSPKIFLYTNKSQCSIETVKKIFRLYQPGAFIDIIDESRLHKTLFISYGAPDEEMASKINKSLKSKGVKTWFFPEDRVPGQKLHRMMSEAVYKYDRTLLICSKDSVVRGGVLNEIERLLEREAAEGGADIIIPVALDDYIFNEWQPEREDIKKQVTSRVVCKINEDNFESEIQKIVSALRH